MLQGAPVEVYGAPRRLAAACAGILVKQPDETKEVTGPPKSVAYDSVGKADARGRKLRAKDELAGRKPVDGDHTQRGISVRASK